MHVHWWMVKWTLALLALAWLARRLWPVVRWVVSGVRAILAWLKGPRG